MTKPIPDEPQHDGQNEGQHEGQDEDQHDKPQGNSHDGPHDNSAAAVDRLPFFHAHRRLVMCGLLFVVAGGAAYALGRSPSLALLLGFDAAALVFLVLTARVFGQASSASMRVHAKQQDVGRMGVLWSSVALSIMVLVALWVELRGESSVGGVVDMLAAAATIVLSWLYMNMIFALHYAHGYYGHRSGTHKGLDFPGTQEPDYWDFAYFAMVLGMTFQVSDVQIVNRRVRRMALVHSVIAFFFNVFIIAISVNVAAGKA
ncbi:DUF1345 domain-containing protein [Achromobacter kerstersii]|uniref:DUF1345 domain-containing protein n=1 Tax=Achromobacter kerstersii TaxID=1353890 RepID=UPI0006BF089C|nr:DUF1345 domain-containing protein [Achromobacter kerstersii]CUI84786.1 Predicted membrane protein [Achromobacter kerstersii]